MNRSTPGLPVHHQLPEFTQTHVHRIGDAIQPSHPLSPLLLLPSIFPNISIFFNESALCIKWPKYWSFSFSISQSVSSVAQSCPTLCDPINCSKAGLPVHHQLPEFMQTHVHQLGDAIQPSHPLSPRLLLPPIPPSIRVFSNQSTLHMRWPKYWSFSLSISLSNEHP